MPEIIYHPSTPGGPAGDRAPNRLIHEKSPYLLQHAYNPVDWYPWGEAAFAEARAGNKLIFLSIGYSTCHWCHVMEVESFEDREVAERMNEVFVSIKVDREERPDIDSIYMKVAMILNGSGGWPLNIIMTPDQKPFFAGTYIPKGSRFQRTGILELIPRVQEIWQTDPGRILELAGQLTTAIRKGAADPPGEILGVGVLEAASRGLSGQFDAVHGGFGAAPKFPTPHNLLFLLRYWKRTGETAALDMVTATLQAMRNGGIYDHVGFGFHRYSTDARWFAPHFEKMLYDQAMLAMAYTEAYLATGDSECQEVAREIFTYVLRDMTDPQGGFYSAEDADSEGEEGLFYLWTEDEVREHLRPADADFVIARFNLTPAGNFSGESGLPSNILHLTAPLGQDSVRWEPLRAALFAAREARIHPYKDDKVLTDWNGLMIAALAKGGRTYNEPAYVEAARAAAEFILSNLLAENGRLLHRYRGGEAGIQATIDDYAFLTWGLLELYETTFEVRYLENGLAFQEALVRHFWDETHGGFYLTADDSEELLARPKEVYDGAIPSGNSIAMLNLLRLGRITGNPGYEERAAAVGRAFARDVQSAPMGFTQLLNAVDFGLGPSFEIVIAGEPGAADTQAMLAALRGRFIPNKIVLLRPPGDDRIVKLAEFTRDQRMVDQRSTAYICRNYTCEKPTTDVATMLALLEGYHTPAFPG